ncbi:MAG: oligosaccharide flippase family protein [Bacteroidales bacterium]|nr:oligosaccharide flippase family protein [Bacteroidales bacterium]
MITFRNFTQSFFQSLYFRRSVVLIAGTAVSQIIALLFQLILRRLFLPEVFGAFALYLSTFSILATLTSLKYENAIIIPKSGKKAVHLFYLSFFLNILFSLLLFVVFLLFRDEFSHLIGLNDQYSHWFLVLPLSLLFFGFYKVINFMLIREKRFRYASLNKVIRRSFEGAGQTTAGVLGFSSGLVWGHLLGSFSNNISGLLQLRKMSCFAQPFEFSTLKGVMRRFGNFPKYQAFPHMLNTFSFTLPVIIVNILYNQEITGFFDLTRQALALPLALVSTSLSQVVLQDISERRNHEQPIWQQVSQTFKMLLIISLPGILIVLFWGQNLFAFFFGSEWVLSGKMAQILIFSYAIRFVITPLSPVLTALERLKILALWRITYFLAILSLFLFTHIDIFLFFKIYMGIEVGFYTLYFIMIWSVCLNYDRKLGSSKTIKE